MKRLAILACLVFSGLCALVYQIVWTRLLGLSFGTTTEAIATVLGIFFGGLALGNWLSARSVGRLERPLRVYAALELGVGAWALLSLPLLQRLDDAYQWMGVPASAADLALLRIAVASALLLPPTIAMGATLPMVARGLVRDDASLGRTSAWIYATNTFGAVIGAYASGFWWIPLAGLTRTLLGAALVNLAVAGLAFAAGHALRAPTVSAAPAPEAAAARRTRELFLGFFAVSGFVAIGYEIVWSKVFGIVMEGTLYGFASVLSAVLAGIALGSAAIAGRVDRIADPRRAFAWVHLAIGACVVLGMAAVPYLPWAHELLASRLRGDAVHLLYLLVLPIVLAPMALFGVAFPILIRIYAQDAGAAARGLGVATAVNTLGSIAASFCVGFWWIPAWGTDATLYALLMLDLGVALAALLAAAPPLDRPARARSLAGGVAVVCAVSLAYGGVRIDEAVAGRQLKTPVLADYVRGLQQAASERVWTLEGRDSVVSVYANPQVRMLRTNGMPEAGVNLAPPHFALENISLAAWPYALAAEPRRALVIGLGGASTLAALLTSQVESIEVVELERGVVQAVEVLHAGLPDPLADPRVTLRIDDGRNFLLRSSRSGAPGYDLISSQPSHPWRVGAANLFTEEFFQIARAALRDGGVFVAWLNGFRIDSEAFLAVVASFERVFPGALLIDSSQREREAFLLIGAREPIALDTERFAARIAEPALAALLREHGVGTAELLARIEGPARAFAALAPDASNTDDNAFVETRAPRSHDWSRLDFASLEARLPYATPIFPQLRGSWDPESVARALLAQGSPERAWPYARKLARLLSQHGAELPAETRALLTAEAALRDPQQVDAALRRLQALADANPRGPEASRVLGSYYARVRSDWRAASAAYAEAYARSGSAEDAYDAGRALHPLDPAGARRWFARIPAGRRAAFPRLAFYDAVAALERGLHAEALDEIGAALERFVASDAGRRYPGALELASRVASARGDTALARRHADADAQQRADEARPLIEQARRALAAGRTDEARLQLDAVEKLTPGDADLARMRAEIALSHGTLEELERALAALRASARSEAQAIGAENAFRSEHALPLWPEPPQRRTAPSKAAPERVAPRNDVG